MAEFREWAPLDFLMSRLPPLTKYARDQSVTALTATEVYSSRKSLFIFCFIFHNLPFVVIVLKILNFQSPYVIRIIYTHAQNIIALGTDAGTVFWYSRREDSLQRIECSGPAASITSLDLVETVDYMLAAGSLNGDLSLFQIPKPVQSEVAVPYPGTDKDMRQFRVTNMHRQSVTCLKWSRNGEKLFSGDKGGQVVESSVAFVMNEVSSRVISDENCKILSLDYLFVDYNTRLLLVSTIKSTFAYSFNSKNIPKFVKIGQKSRRPGHFASMLLQAGLGRAGLKFVVVRPNDRLWVTDAEGKVERTIILREAIRRRHSQSQILVINPSYAAEDEDTNIARVNLLSAAEQLVIVWSTATLHIVSLISGQVLTSCHSFRNIYNICRTSDSEFFVHETRRSIVRIGTQEDITVSVKNLRSSTIADTEIESTLENFGSQILLNISQFRKLKSPALSSSLNIESFRAKLTNIVSSNDRSPSPEVFDSLMGFDYKNPNDFTDVRSAFDNDRFANKDFIAKMDSIGSREYDEDIVVNSKKSSKQARITNNRNETEAETDRNSDAKLTLSMITDENDMSSPEKEEKLMKMLKLEEEGGDTVCDESSDRPMILVEASSQTASINTISYGPPSDSSNVTSSIHSTERELKLEEVAVESCILPLVGLGQDQEMEVVAEKIEDGLYRYKLPGQAGSLCGSEGRLWFCDNRENVFYSEINPDRAMLLWRRAEIMASSVVTSPCGNVVWRMHRNTAYCLVTEAGYKQEWRRLCDNVQSIWLGTSSGWLVKHDGGLVGHHDLGPHKAYSARPRHIVTSHIFSRVIEAEGWLLGLTSALNQLYKCPLDQLTSETDWLTVPKPDYGTDMSVLAVGPRGHLWVTDTGGRVYVSPDQETWARLPDTNLTEATASAPVGVLPLACCGPVLVPETSGLFLASALSSSLLLQRYPITAYSWSRLSLSSQLSGMEIQTLEAGGWDTWGGSLLLTDNKGLALKADPKGGALCILRIPSQETVAKLSAVPRHILLLSKSGKIFIKKDWKDSWSSLSLDELCSERLVSVSLASTPSTGLVWAVDTSGGVFMRLGSMDPPLSNKVRGSIFFHSRNLYFSNSYFVHKESNFRNSVDILSKNLISTF